MKIFDGHLAYAKSKDRNASASVVTIGNFDGLHRGHRAILQAVVQRARREKLTSLVYTFTPHPRDVLHPESKPEKIYSYDERRMLTRALNMDVFVEEPFDHKFSQLEAKDFFETVLVKSLDTKILYVGHDFGFGKGRSGGKEMLDDLCRKHQIELRKANPLKIENEICSSTKIRELLSLGLVDQAETFLGAKYFLRGIVVRGDGRGKQIGFPTANMKCGRTPILKPGVYCNEVVIGETVHQAVTNIGRRPTFHSVDAALTIETHILGFSEDLYDREIELRFVAFLRDEKKFASVDELKLQISEDIRQARRRFFLD